MAINKVILVGNVGNDPEIRNLNNGNEVANFSLATTESWKSKDTGERKDRTEWHRIVVFSQGLVGIIKNYIRKGSKLYVEGALQTRKWTDANGVEKYSTEIVLQNFNSTIQMLDSKGSGGSQGGAYDSGNSGGANAGGGYGNQGAQGSGSPAAAGDQAPVEEIDDDIPF